MNEAAPLEKRGSLRVMLTETEPDAWCWEAMGSGGDVTNRVQSPLEGTSATQYQLTSVMLGYGPSVTRSPDFSREAMN